MTEDRICLECERLGVRKAFKRKAFHSHLLVHKMTQIEYAHKYNTEEIMKCFICKKEIYVCFDGVFIHGLDRPITEIARKALVSKFNANIFNKYYSDRSFEEYCQKRNINLVRFDENSFEDFLFDNKKLEPYFTCGASKVIDQFLFMLHK